MNDFGGIGARKAFCRPRRGGTAAKTGKIDAASLLTMDQFKSDEIVRFVADQNGDQKRQGLVISDRPDNLSPQAEKLISDLDLALRSTKSEAEADTIRKDYLSRLPAREFVARRLFAGRGVEGASIVTLSDPDGKPRLQLKVDKRGQAAGETVGFGIRKGPGGAWFHKPEREFCLVFHHSSQKPFCTVRRVPRERKALGTPP